ncbi:hypothetical protein CAEBREN_00792 [Caenorhabditis brenneri]|uniref:Uncharacterized protein n=1 Tax=Caenorhabditis brenneri TaxID=135651 RepID=G0NKG0_CAEBE|nr:hypothetical protein CAEBREN_00792 [Caenorhabditis brenneri]
MENNENPPRTIREALDQLFVNGPPPPPQGPFTLAQLLERLFITSFEMKLDDPPILLPEQPNLHLRPPGHGATWRDWNRYFSREAREVMPIGRGLPLPVFAWILVRLTREERRSFLDALRANRANQREQRNQH